MSRQSTNIFDSIEVKDLYEKKISKEVFNDIEEVINTIESIVTEKYNVELTKEDSGIVFLANSKSDEIYEDILEIIDTKLNISEGIRKILINVNKRGKYIYVITKYKK